MTFQKYKVILSNKAEIPIDEDEVENVMLGIQTGRIVKVRQGVFNPSFFVAMVIDEERKKRWIGDNEYRDFNKNPENRELNQLPDIFKDIKKLASGMRMPPKPAPYQLQDADN